MTDTPTRSYPLTGTCDGCSQGTRPLREADPESEAWICAECDALHDRGVQAAAAAMDTTVAIASLGIDAYFAATEDR